jgi:hypothetical protein
MTRLLKSRSPSVSINYHPFKVPNLLTLGNRYLQVVALPIHPTIISLSIIPFSLCCLSAKVPIGLIYYKNKGDVRPFICFLLSIVVMVFVVIVVMMAVVMMAVVMMAVVMMAVVV